MNTRIRASAHPFRTLIQAGLMAGLAVVLIAGTAFAAKPSAGGGGGGKPHGGGGTSSGGTLALVLLNSPDGRAHFGGSVTYSMSTTATIYPYVATSCVQNGKQVLSASAGYFPSYPWPSAQAFTLGPTGYWTSGAADCTARLYSTDGGGETTLATITYSVSP